MPEDSYDSHTITRLTSELKEYKDREANLRKLNDSLAIALKDMEDSRRITGKREIEILIENHSKSLEEAKTVSEEKLRRLKEENEGLRERLKEVEDWRRSVSSNCEAKIRRYEREVKEIGSRHKEALERIESLKEENGSLQRKVEELSSVTMSNYGVMRVNELVGEKKALANQVNSLNNRMAELSSQYESRTRIYDSKMNEMGQSLASISQSNDSLCCEVESLKELLSLKEAEIGFYRKKSSKPSKVQRSPTETMESFFIESSTPKPSLLVASPTSSRRKPQVALINLNEEKQETMETNLSIDTSIREKYFSPSPRVLGQKATPKKEANTSRVLRGKVNDSRVKGKEESKSSRANPQSNVHVRTKSANIHVSKTPKKSFQKVETKPKLKPKQSLGKSPLNSNSNHLQSTAVFGNIGNVECRNCLQKFGFQEFVRHSEECGAKGRKAAGGRIDKGMVGEFVNILKEKNIPSAQHEDLLKKFFFASDVPSKP